MTRKTKEQITTIAAIAPFDKSRWVEAADVVPELGVEPSLLSGCDEPELLPCVPEAPEGDPPPAAVPVAAEGDAPEVVAAYTLVIPLVSPPSAFATAIAAPVVVAEAPYAAADASPVVPLPFVRADEPDGEERVAPAPTTPAED